MRERFKKAGGEDWEGILLTRGAVYDLFRRFLLEEPNREYLKICVNYRSFETFPMQKQNAKIENGVAKIQAYLKAHNVCGDEDAYQELHWDYTRMFLGPMGIPAPLWASAYLEKDRILFSKTTLYARKLYEKYGYQAGARINEEADDHLGYELDFLYRLNQKCLDESLSGKQLVTILQDQIRLVEDHLERFVPEVKRLTEEHARLDFYPGLLLILEGYLEEDKEILYAMLRNVKEEELSETEREVE